MTNPRDPQPNGVPPAATDEDSPPLGAGLDLESENSPLAGLFVGYGHIVAVLALGLAFFLLASAPLSHTDFWAHLKYGEWMLAQQLAR